MLPGSSRKWTPTSIREEATPGPPLSTCPAATAGGPSLLGPPASHGRIYTCMVACVCICTRACDQPLASVAGGGTAWAGAALQALPTASVGDPQLASVITCARREMHAHRPPPPCIASVCIRQIRASIIKMLPHISPCVRTWVGPIVDGCRHPCLPVCTCGRFRCASASLSIGWPIDTEPNVHWAAQRPMARIIRSQTESFPTCAPRTLSVHSVTSVLPESQLPPARTD